MEKSINYNKLKNPLDFKLLKDKVYEAIKEKIIDLSFKPGEQLMEKHLAEELGVSKSPIRDAFQRLEQEGLVYTIPFKGCYVAKVSIKEFKEVFQLREALELFCINEGLRSYTDEDIKDFKQIMTLAQNHLRNGDENRTYEEHINFHKLIVKKLGNTLIENIYSNIEDKLKRYLTIAVKYIPNRISLSNQQHFRLLKAIEKKDISLATKELKNHLSNILEDYLDCEEIRKLS